ncbi:unnamed protein product [marine sediment metagenome]|uniref:Uncharacterized protein n=1 Tax=marine sediment metagenome TaxID=412755 RepID=X0YS62_9ZZZZ
MSNSQTWEVSYDHLYLFSYQNRFGVWEEVHHPYMEEGSWTDEVMVGDVPLRVGQRMNYVFDFGDWRAPSGLEGRPGPSWIQHLSTL